MRELLSDWLHGCMGELLRSWWWWWLGGCLGEWDLRHLRSESRLRLTESLLFLVLAEEVVSQNSDKLFGCYQLNRGFFLSIALRPTMEVAVW